MCDRAWKDLTELEDYLNIFETIEFDSMFVELILEKATERDFFIQNSSFLTSIIIAKGAFGGRCLAVALLPIPFT